MSPSTDYWATVAQVIPVFALAIVVEARVIKWNELPRGVRTFNILVLVGLSVAMAFTENSALSGVRGEPLGQASVSLAEVTISVSLSFVILNPVFAFLPRGLAESFATAFTSYPGRRLHVAILRFKIERQVDSLASLRARLWSLVQSSRAQGLQARAMVTGLDESIRVATLRGVGLERLQDLEAMRKQALTIVDGCENSSNDLEGEWRQMISDEVAKRAERLAHRDEFYREFMASRTTERRALAAAFLTGEPAQVRAARFRDLEPDDGGFLPEDP